MKKLTLGARKAFTLVELVIVILVLGILSTVAVVGYEAVISKSGDEVAEAAGTAFDREVRALLAFNSDRPITKADLDDAVARAAEDLNIDPANFAHETNDSADLADDIITWSTDTYTVTVALTGTITTAGSVTASYSGESAYVPSCQGAFDGWALLPNGTDCSITAEEVTTITYTCDSAPYTTLVSDWFDFIDSEVVPADKCTREASILYQYQIDEYNMGNSISIYDDYLDGVDGGNYEYFTTCGGYYTYVALWWNGNVLMCNALQDWGWMHYPIPGNGEGMSCSVHAGGSYLAKQNGDNPNSLPSISSTNVADKWFCFHMADATEQTNTSYSCDSAGNGSTLIFYECVATDAVS